MAYVELKQHLWMSTPFGEGRCIATMDYGQEDDLLWVCIQQEEPHVGALWTWHNSEVRVMSNRTYLRGSPTQTNTHIDDEFDPVYAAYAANGH